MTWLRKFLLQRGVINISQKCTIPISLSISLSENRWRKALADLNLAQPTLFTDGVSMSVEIRATGCNHLRAVAC